MIYSILLVAQLWMHPFHVSVSDVKFQKEEKIIQVSTRIFLDDLEVALRLYSGNDRLDITDKDSWDFVNEQLSRYLSEKLKMYNEKGQLLMTYVGAEIEDDVMWTYTEVKRVKKFKSITIWNGILTEAFDDQENIVHFRAFEKVKSARLYKGEEREVFVWE